MPVRDKTTSISLVSEVICVVLMFLIIDFYSFYAKITDFYSFYAKITDFVGYVRCVKWHSACQS